MSHHLATPEPPAARKPKPSPAPAPRHHEPRHRKSNAELVHDGEEDSFVLQHGKKLIVACIVVLAVGVYFMPKPGPSAPVRKAEKIVSVQLPPPPPKLPPPPPPKVQPPPEKMEKQAPVADEKPKEAAPKKSDNPPPTALATGIKGDGVGMGLASSGSGIGGGNLIGGQTGGGGGGSKWGAYASQVQSRIAEALRSNATTRTASINNLQVRIWPDATGRITRASLAGSTGNASVDAAIESQVLSGLRLQEPPPAGMKLPIVLRLSARRP